MYIYIYMCIYIYIYIYPGPCSFSAGGAKGTKDLKEAAGT